MNNAFSAFKIIHSALLIGQLLFIGIMLYLVYSNIITTPFTGNDKALQVAAVLFSALAFFAGNHILKKRSAALRDNTVISPKERFEKYRAACIMQWALLEGAALFCGICFFLSGNYAFLVLAAALILFFALQTPGKSKTASQSGLSIDEIDLL